MNSQAKRAETGGAGIAGPRPAKQAGKQVSAVALAASLFVTSHAVAAPTSVESVEARRVANGREIVIRTSKAPTFSVFRLSDPFRILIDVSDAEIATGLETQRFDGDAVLTQISVTPFAAEQAKGARVEIALDARRPYDVEARGNSIVARVEVEGETAPPAEIKLGKLRHERSRDGVAIALPTSGTPSPDAVSILELEDPARVVIDIAGATAEPRYQKHEVKRAGVERARLATSADGVRIVLDLLPKTALPEVNVEAAGGELRVAVHPAPANAPAVAKAEIVEEPAAPEAKPEPVAPAAPVTAPSPAPVVQAPAPKAAPAVDEALRPAEVIDVRFEPKDGFMRLTVELSKDAASSKDADSTRLLPMIRLGNTKLPEALARTLDTSAVAGAIVKSISSYTEGGDTILAAQVGADTEHRNWRKGNKLIWDFRARVTTAAVEPSAAEPARVLPYAEQATSGFESTAIDLMGKTAVGRQRYRGRRISLDLKDADILNVLRLLADVSKLNIVAADDVNGSVTLKLRNVPWDQALDIILQAKKLDKTRNGNIIRVAPITVLEQEEQLRLSRKEAQEKLEPMSVRLIPVNYATAEAVKTQIAPLLSPRGKVSVDTRTNVLVIEDVAEVLLKAERLTRTLDTQTPQVLIEARIVEAATGFSRDLGIQWGGQALMTPSFGTQTGLQFPNTITIRGASDDGQTPTAGVLGGGNNFAINLPAAAGLGAGGALGFVFGSAGGAQLLSLRLTAAELQGKSKIISAPKIVTMDNVEAKIVSGEKIPITVLTANGPSTRFIDANLELTVTPHVTSDGSIMMKLKATKNELSNRQDILGTPGVITREANTEMLVRDGDTAVMGGIYRRTATEARSYVPWIGQVPVLGWLFKKINRSDAREELLIFMSPRIVNRSQSMVSGR